MGCRILVLLTRKTRNMVIWWLKHHFMEIAAYLLFNIMIFLVRWPGKIMWRPVKIMFFINAISNTQTTSACFLKISSLKYEGWLFTAAFCYLYLHSSRWELCHSIGSVDGLCGFVATTSNSGGPSLRVPSHSLVFVFGHFVCCGSKIWYTVQMDRTVPLVKIS